MKNLLIQLSNIIFGFSIFNFFHKRKKTSDKIVKINNLVKSKYLREAITLIDEALALWSYKPNFFEKILWAIFLNSSLDSLREMRVELKSDIRKAEAKINEADELYIKASDGEESLNNISKSIKLYSDSQNLLFNPKLASLIDNLNNELSNYRKLNSILYEADNKANQYYFRDAVFILEKYKKEENIESPKLSQKIDEYRSQFGNEDEFEENLIKVKNLVSINQFYQAKDIINSTKINPTRVEWQKILKEVEDITRFQIGIISLSALEINEKDIKDYPESRYRVIVEKICESMPSINSGGYMTNETQKLLKRYYSLINESNDPVRDIIVQERFRQVTNRLSGDQLMSKLIAEFLDELSLIEITTNIIDLTIKELTNILKISKVQEKIWKIQEKISSLDNAFDSIEEEIQLILETQDEYIYRHFFRNYVKQALSLISGENLSRIDDVLIRRNLKIAYKIFPNDLHLQEVFQIYGIKE